MKAVYFSGRFDRTSGAPGIYLPINEPHLRLYPRRGVPAHSQCRTFTELLRTSVNSRPKKVIDYDDHPLKRLFQNNEDSNSTYLNINEFVSSLPSEGNLVAYEEPHVYRNLDTAIEENNSVDLILNITAPIIQQHLPAELIPATNETSLFTTNEITPREHLRQRLLQALPSQRQVHIVEDIIRSGKTEQMLNSYSVDTVQNMLAVSFDVEGPNSMILATKIKDIFH